MLSVNYTTFVAGWNRVKTAHNQNLYSRENKVFKELTVARLLLVGFHFMFHIVAGTNT
jgi:hypothetical protein